jgi:hypothetical protein
MFIFVTTQISKHPERDEFVPLPKHHTTKACIEIKTKIKLRAIFTSALNGVSNTWLLYDRGKSRQYSSDRKPGEWQS